MDRESERQSSSSLSCGNEHQGWREPVQGEGLAEVPQADDDVDGDDGSDDVHTVEIPRNDVGNYGDDRAHQIRRLHVFPFFLTLTTQLDTQLEWLLPN